MLLVNYDACIFYCIVFLLVYWIVAIVCLDCEECQECCECCNLNNYQGKCIHHHERPILCFILHCRLFSIVCMIGYFDQNYMLCKPVRLATCFRWLVTYLNLVEVACCKNDCFVVDVLRKKSTKLINHLGGLVGFGGEVEWLLRLI